MSGGPVIDSVEFARKGGSQSGSIAVAGFERLRAGLSDASGTVSYTLDGFVNGEEKPVLRLRVGGTLRLTCQRCLGSLEHALATDREFVLVDGEEALVDPAEESALVEHIPADPKLDVADFIESEVLLELPLSPLHREGACSPPDWETVESDQDRPFGALTALRRNG